MIIYFVYLSWLNFQTNLECLSFRWTLHLSCLNNVKHVTSVLRSSPFFCGENRAPPVGAARGTTNSLRVYIFQAYIRWSRIYGVRVLRPWEWHVKKDDMAVCYHVFYCQQDFQNDEINSLRRDMGWE